jgi:hypothetical protein
MYKNRKGITDGVGLPVAVSHDSDHCLLRNGFNRHIINTPDANLIIFRGPVR